MSLRVRSIIGTVLSAVLLSLWPVAESRAADPPEPAVTWGLIGTWALDCKKPASLQNGYLSYKVNRSGTVIHHRDFGDRQDEFTVLNTTIKMDGTIELVFDGNEALPEKTRLVLLKNSQGRIRAVEHETFGTGEFSVRNGVFAHNSQQSPWQYLCKS